MKDIEILAYTYIDRDEFRKYCIEGKPNGIGGHHTDPQGRKITGVLDWLRGRGVREAHFFRSEKPTDHVQLFAATIKRKESYDVPWMGNVPGFEAMVNVEGLIGKTDSFASFTDLVASVKTDTEMDNLYKKRRDSLDALLIRMAEKPEAMPTVGKQRLLAALRGELGSNADEVFEEVEKKFPDLLFRR
jgi:hypothetical protein